MKELSHLFGENDGIAFVEFTSGEAFREQFPQYIETVREQKMTTPLFFNIQWLRHF